MKILPRQTKILPILLFLTIAFIAPSWFSVPVNAQLPLSVSITISSTPTDKTATARATVVGGDPDQSVFQWFKDGALIQSASGKGRDSYSVSLGKEARITIDVTVTTEDGRRASATRAITKESPAIVWWADTFIPYWYKGKAVPSPESTITLLAIPGAGVGEPASDLRYSWTIGGESHPEVSGIGKNSFTLTVSRAVSVAHQVTVKISNQSQTITQESTILVPVQNTETLVYQIMPSGGADPSQALSLFTGNSGETHDFIAYPFFFRTDSVPGLEYLWKVNDQSITGIFDRPNVLTLRTRQGEKNTNAIGVTIKETGPAARQEKEAFFTANFQ